MTASEKMTLSKPLKPRKVEGTLKVGGKKIEIGVSSTTVTSSTPEKTKKVIREISRKKIFPIPQFINE